MDFDNTPPPTQPPPKKSQVPKAIHEKAQEIINSLALYSSGNHSLAANDILEYACKETNAGLKHTKQQSQMKVTQAPINIGPSKLNSRLTVRHSIAPLPQRGARSASNTSTKVCSMSLKIFVAY